MTSPAPIKLAAVWLVLAPVLFVAAGCAGSRAGGDFTRTIDKIQPGMTQSQVREALGSPDRKTTGVAELDPPPGPTMALVGAVPVGSRYEDWFYRRGDTHYHVYFGASNTHPGRWEVVATPRASPASAAVGDIDPGPSPR